MLPRLTGRQRHAHVQGAARVETRAEAIRQYARVTAAGRVSGRCGRGTRAGRRSPTGGLLAHEKATRPLNPVLYGLRAISAPVSSSRLVTTCRWCPSGAGRATIRCSRRRCRSRGLPGRVGQRQPRRLHRSGGTRRLELLVQLPCGPFEPREARAMANNPWSSGRSRQRARRGAPHLAAFLVAKKDGLRRRVRRPRRSRTASAGSRGCCPTR